jgi:hypothetical protein
MNVPNGQMNGQNEWSKWMVKWMVNNEYLHWFIE